MENKNSRDTDGENIESSAFASAGGLQVPAPKKRGSIIVEHSNPLESGSLDSFATIRVENLTDAKRITNEEIASLIATMKKISENVDRLSYLEKEKLPYLFVCDNLIKLFDITPSVKTRMAMVAMIGPRLVDPKNKMTEIVETFRFADEREKVEEILKARIQTLSASIFSKANQLNTGRGGRGGRGAPTARGRGRGNVDSAASSPSISASTSMTKLDIFEASSPVTSTPIEAVAVKLPNPPPTAAASAHDTATTTPEKPQKVEPIVVATAIVDVTPIPIPPKVAPAKAPRDPSPPSPVVAEPEPMDPLSILLSKLHFTQFEYKDTKEFWELKILAEEKRNNEEIRLVLQALGGLPLEQALSIVEKECWERRLEAEVEYRESELSIGNIQKEISSVWNAVGLSSQQAHRFSSSLENWEKKVVSSILEGESTSRFDEVLHKRESFYHEIAVILSTVPENEEVEFDDVNNERKSNDSVESFTRQSSIRTSPVSTRAGSCRLPLFDDRPMESASAALQALAATFDRYNVTGNNGLSLSLDEIERSAKSAFALNMNPKYFLHMDREESLGVNAQGVPMYSYKELLRRNHVKEYEDLEQRQLEQYLTDEDFFVRFSMTKEMFYALPKWRQIALKKAVMLF